MRPRRLLGGVARFVHARPRGVLAGCLLLALFSWALAVVEFSYTADRTRLLKEDTEVQRDLKKFQAEFGDREEGVVVVSGADPERRRETVNRLLEMAQRHPQQFTRATGYFNLSSHRPFALYYLSPERLQEIRDQMARGRPLIEALGQGGLEGVVGRLDDLEADNPEILEQLKSSLKTGGRKPYQSPFELEEFPERIYLTHQDVHLLLFESPRPLEAERLIRAAPRAAATSVEVTGEPVIQAQDSRQTLQGATVSAICSIILVKLLFIFGYGEARRPRLPLAALLIGLSWAIGFACWWVDDFNLITINFVSILVGLGVDFGIHILYRYDEEFERNGDRLAAMTRALETSGSENLTGAVATATAFLALTFTDFQAIVDLGWISGAGVLLCFLATVLVLPAFLFLERPGQTVERRSWGFLKTWQRWLEERRGAVIAVAVAVTMTALILGTRVGFDYNLLNLQAKDAPAANFERSGRFSSLYAFASAADLDEARSLSRRLEGLPSVQQVQSLGDYLPQVSDEKEALIGQILNLAQGWKLPEPRLERSAAELKALRDLLRDSAWARELDDLGPGPVETGLGAFESAFLADLNRLNHFLLEQKRGEFPPLPQELRERWIGKSGCYRLRIVPREVVWDRAPLERLVVDLKSVVGEVTGPCVLIYAYLESLRVAYLEAGKVALVVISLLLLVHFRSLRYASLALLPKILGIVWMLGVMGLAGVDFNPANCMALPLILGIGLVFGIHIVDRFLESPEGSVLGHSTGPAVGLSALTTVAGFGCLMLASHRGIASLGFVMAAGVGANLLASAVVLPVLLRKR